MVAPTRSRDRRSVLIGNMAGDPVNMNEYQELARQALPKMHYDFCRFRLRILIDVSKISLSTTILGYNVAAPIMIAPTALHKLAHPEGEVATARAAAACSVIMVYKRRDITAPLVQRAERSGYKAIVLTVDVPRLGRREADIKNK
ncbi:hypothetical protein NL676_028417 [Syzygium grande]|nr:hypothetical protein NL676_028417 [Syzygium grande]